MLTFKLFKKFLHKISTKAKKEIDTSPYLHWLKKFNYKGMWSLHQYSAAAGIATGIFCAFIPLPMQMLCAAFLAIPIRANILLAISATWITNPFTFIPINVFLLKVGAVITNTHITESMQIRSLDINWQHIWQSLTEIWETLKILGKPFLVGALVVAITAACATFIVIYTIWGLFDRAKHRRV